MPKMIFGIVLEKNTSIFHGCEVLIEKGHCLASQGLL